MKMSNKYFPKIYWQYFILAALLIAFIKICNAKITATTNKTIQGSPPELSSKHQVDIASGHDFTLLSLQAKSAGGITNIYYSDEEFNLKLAQVPIIGNKTFKQLSTYLADDTGSTILSGAKHDIADTDAFDINGDGNFTLDATEAGANWYYINNSGIETPALQTQSFCDVYGMSGGNLPYIKIAGTSILSTQYGDPNKKSYANTKRIFNLSFSGSPIICFAQPNSEITYPSNNLSEWNSSYGFLMQDVSTPSSNFPTTGSHNLYFYLMLVGVTSEQVISATPSDQLTQGNVKILLSDDDSPAKNPNRLKVTLTGPNYNNPGAFTPAEFHIKAPSLNGSVNIYSFTLSKWFIANPNSLQYSSDNITSLHPQNDTATNETQKYCKSLLGEYRVPSVEDYTNASGYKWVGDNVSNNYYRAINGALFSEWGYVNARNYKSSDWLYSYYWANEPYNSESQYAVRSDSGFISYYTANNTSSRAACVSP